MRMYAYYISLTIDKEITFFPADTKFTKRKQRNKDLYVISFY